MRSAASVTLGSHPPFAARIINGSSGQNLTPTERPIN